LIYSSGVRCSEDSLIPWTEKVDLAGETVWGQRSLRFIYICGRDFKFYMYSRINPEPGTQ